MPPAQGRSFKILAERLHPDLQVDGKTELIRYMKASTFLLLLGGKVFIPTLSTLQSCDRLEALVPNTVWCLYLHLPSVHPWGTLWKFIEDSEEWLKLRADRNKPDVVQEDLSKIWLRELSIRRCIWCWNRYRDKEESHALWNSYGHRGVAVVSTLDQIDAALEAARPFKGLVGSIKYVLPRSHFEDQETPKDLVTSYSMWVVENLRRPYFYKDSGYRFEGEVRLVIAANARVVTEKGGALVDVDPKKLIKKIVVSPQLPEDERRMLKAFGDDLKKAESISLNFPLTEKEEFERSRGPEFQPLTIEEGLPPLFDDLDSTSPDIPGAGHLREPPPEGHVW
jgi:hypothetical protein